MSDAWCFFTSGKEMLSGGRFGLLVVAPWHDLAEVPEPQHLQQQMAFNSSDILATAIKFRLDV